MTIALRVAGTAVVNTTAPNPSTGAGAAASDLSILWVAAKPAVNRTPAEVAITTPSTWALLGVWASGSQTTASPPGDSNSTLIAAYVKVGAAASTAIGAMTITNISTAAAAINTYSTTLTNGWEYSAVTSGTDETGSTFAPIGTANLSLASGSWLMAGFAHKLNSAISSQAIAAAGATLTSPVFRHNTGSVLNSGNLGFGTYDSSVTAGTSSAGPLLTSPTNTDGVAAFVRVKDTSVSITSADTVTIYDHVSGVPSTRVWQNGQIAYANDLNFQVRDSFNWLMGNTRPGLQVRNLTTIPYASAAETKITWDAADDQAGDIWWWPGSSAIVVGEPGIYTGRMDMSAQDTGTMSGNWLLFGRIYVRRAGTIVETIVQNAINMDTEQSFSYQGNPFNLYLRAGDHLELTISGGWASGGGATWPLQLDTQLMMSLWWSSKWEG